MTQNLILNKTQIDHKVKRIAYQIYETFIDEKQIVIAGITGNGYLLAKLIVDALTQISPLEVELCEVKINKQHPMQEVTTSISAEQYANKSLVLVDDVLHTGTTLVYGLKHFLNVPLTKIKTAVLIDRNHKKYPIKVDFKGLSLSTSLQEHVEVSFSEGDYQAYLS